MTNSPPSLAALRRLNRGLDSIGLLAFSRAAVDAEEWIDGDEWVTFTSHQLDYISAPEVSETFAQELVALAWRLGGE